MEPEDTPLHLVMKLMSLESKLCSRARCRPKYIRTNSPEDKAALARFIGFLDGPYGTGETPTAVTMHLFLRVLAAYEIGLVSIVVNMLFARFALSPYDRMHHDPPRTRMICQLLVMFPESFHPESHRKGVAAAIVAGRRRDPERRIRTVRFLHLKSTMIV